MRGLTPGIHFMGYLQNEPNDDKDGINAAKDIQRREELVADIIKSFAAVMKK